MTEQQRIACKVCQCCGKLIYIGDESVEIRYGKMHATAHPHYKVRPKRIDHFHRSCDIAVLGKIGGDQP